jgi:hypothetical protein
VAALMEDEQGQEDGRPLLLLGGFPLGEVVCLPCSPRPAVDGGRVEDLIGSAAEYAIRTAPLRSDKLLIEEVTQDREKRNRPLRGLSALDVSITTLGRRVERAAQNEEGAPKRPFPQNESPSGEADRGRRGQRRRAHASRTSPGRG